MLSCPPSSPYEPGNFPPSLGRPFVSGLPLPIPTPSGLCGRPLSLAAISLALLHIQKRSSAGSKIKRLADSSAAINRETAASSPREAGRPRDSPLGAVGCSCCTLPRAVRDGPPGRKTSKLLDEDLTSGASIKLNGRLLLRPPFASFTWPAILLPLSSERRPDPNHLTRRAAPCEQKCKEVI